MDRPPHGSRTLVPAELVPWSALTEEQRAAVAAATGRLDHWLHEIAHRAVATNDATLVALVNHAARERGFDRDIAVPYTTSVYIEGRLADGLARKARTRPPSPGPDTSSQNPGGSSEENPR